MKRFCWSQEQTDKTPVFGSIYQVNLPTQTLESNPKAIAAGVQAYNANATGPLTISGGQIYRWEKLPEAYRSSLSAESLANFSQSPADWPELEHISLFGLPPTVPDTHERQEFPHSFQCECRTDLPRSITIQGTDVTTPPLTDHSFLSTKADAELAVVAIKCY
ncbi:hypothetical protein ACLMJK_003404 [Lecanora helva]